MKSLVAGSSHLDIIAHQSRDDGGDRITIEVGGTAGNVAIYLRRSGVQVRLLTVLGDEPFSNMFESHITSSRIEVVADIVNNMPLAATMVRLTKEGVTESVASSTSVDMHEFSDARIEQSMDGVNFIVIDANLNAATIKKIAAHGKSKDIPLFALGVSPKKVERLMEAAHQCSAVFLNYAEAARMMCILKVADHAEIAEFFGAPVMIMGDRGMSVYHPDGRRTRIPDIKLPHLRNALSVGDAFIAGVIDGIMMYELDFAKAAKYAASCVDEVARIENRVGYSMNAVNKMVGRIFEASRKDALTGMLLRRCFEEEYIRYSRNDSAVIVVDCDNFKNVNDNMGHAVGDKVLCEVAKIIQDCIRVTDTACRWGGDEFVILLPRIKDKNIDDALIVAERIRTSAESASMHGVTLSIGVTIAPAREPLLVAFSRADEAMYDAKTSGKNKVISCV